jgi:2-C-methyl-D-erythritol 4-phosphate cytidylyltransferase
MTVRTWAIVLAGGDGNRFGGELPKQFVRLAGDPILARTLRCLRGANIDRVIVVAHPSWLDDTRRLVDAVELGITVDVVRGGATRNESTRNGFAALHASEDDVVLVHDAVRPLLPLDVILRAVEPILSGRAEATDTVIPSADTLVIVEGERVAEIPERSRYRRGQTPQAFRAGVLERAYAAAEAAGDMGNTDDCSLVLRYVPEARMLGVAGDEINMKITTRTDIVLADRMLQLAVLVPGPDPLQAASLDGARILVVGGTAGIGRAIAQLAAAEGGVAEVTGSSAGLDVRDYPAVEACIASVAARLGGLDHVVVTAGVLRMGRLVDSDPGAFAEVVDVNVTGSLNVARAAYPHLRASRGSITFFASSSFTRGRPDYVPYSASKAAVVNLTQGLAEEWAADGIRVNAISPERTDTPMRRLAFPDEPRDGMLTAEEVAAGTVRVLRSHLTGQVVDVKRADLVAPPDDAGGG